MNAGKARMSLLGVDKAGKSNAAKEMGRMGGMIGGKFLLNICMLTIMCADVI